MIARSMFLAAVLAVSCGVSANAGPLPHESASSGAKYNGVQLNGFKWNGHRWNGYRWNGLRWNGYKWNGFRFNGLPATGALHPVEGSVAGLGGKVVAIEF